MESYSKTDEVLALLNKHERGEASGSAAASSEEKALGFTDFLPSPAAAVLHKLQRVSAQPRSEQPIFPPLTRTASEALKVVLGEQRPVETRKLRCCRYSCPHTLFCPNRCTASVLALHLCLCICCKTRWSIFAMHACRVNLQLLVLNCIVGVAAGAPLLASGKSCLGMSSRKAMKTTSLHKT